jgi:hypothetical protein
METVRALGTAYGVQRTGERGARSQRDADAFRRAMEGGDGREAAHGEQEAPVRTALQPQPAAGRREGQQGHHVDVVA